MSRCRRSRDKDQSLAAALSPLLAEYEAAHPHVTAVRRLAAVAAQYAPFPDALDPRLAQARCGRGASTSSTPIRPSDRARARRPQRRDRHADGVGQDALLQRAVLRRILRDPSTRALYLFPTKALAQDQLAELHQLAELVGRARAAATSACSPTTATRRRTRGARFAARAHVVLSNPDMVHSGILPHHPRWAKLFENLKFVVIDELHAYRGVFGSHLGEHHAAAAARLPALRIESRRSSARRRRSRIRASWPSG